MKVTSVPRNANEFCQETGPLIPGHAPPPWNKASFTSICKFIGAFLIYLCGRGKIFSLCPPVFLARTPCNRRFTGEKQTGFMTYPSRIHGRYSGRRSNSLMAQVITLNTACSWRQREVFVGGGGWGVSGRSPGEAKEMGMKLCAHLSQRLLH